MEELKIKKKTLWMYVLVIAIIIGFFLIRGNVLSGQEIVLTNTIGSNVGDIAPDFSLTDVERDSYLLSQFRGRPVVLAYFATWCVPCQIEADRLKQLDDETGGDEFIVYQIGIDERETVDDLKQFKAQRGNDDWIVGFGIELTQLYNVRALDTTLILDGEGNIIYRDNGIPANMEDLRRNLI